MRSLASSFRAFCERWSATGFDWPAVTLNEPLESVTTDLRAAALAPLRIDAPRSCSAPASTAASERRAATAPAVLSTTDPSHAPAPAGQLTFRVNAPLGATLTVLPAIVAFGEAARAPWTPAAGRGAVEVVAGWDGVSPPPPASPPPGSVPTGRVLNVMSPPTAAVGLAFFA